MYVGLNGDQLEEVECFKYLRSQMAADEGCERDVVHKMNEGYKAWEALKSVLCTLGRMKGRRIKHLHEGVIVPTALYGAGAWGMRSAREGK